MCNLTKKCPELIPNSERAGVFPKVLSMHKFVDANLLTLICSSRRNLDVGGQYSFVPCKLNLLIHNFLSSIVIYPPPPPCSSELCPSSETLVMFFKKHLPTVFKVITADFFCSRAYIWQNLHAHLHGQLLVRNLHGLLFASRLFLHKYFTARKLKFHGKKKTMLILTVNCCLNVMLHDRHVYIKVNRHI